MQQLIDDPSLTALDWEMIYVATQTWKMQIRLIVKRAQNRPPKQEE